ncbi:uncharacterized protein LOC143075918 [Mytilus galloprovincialis]|uniref:uncharacterized protein LOC143075918 n=1 Tax=Mytilus galloprovincialis TaxID=29158 RepID=UPI003F7B8B5D
MQRHVYFLCSVLFIYPVFSATSSTGVQQGLKGSPDPISTTPTPTTTLTPTTTQAPVITYTCNAKGVKSIITKHLEKIRILVKPLNNLYCKPNDANLTNCYNVGNPKVTTLPNPLTVLYEDEKDLKIIGGQKVFFYELKCEDGPQTLTAEATFRTNKTDTIIPRTENTDLKDVLQLKMSSSENELVDLKDNQIGVGDELFLFMIVPDGHSVQPEICTAYPDTKSATIKMWKKTGNDTCNDSDSALIDRKWSGNHTVVHIKIYGFRFVDSQAVTISCSALVCPDSNDCQKFCVNSKSSSAGRRRRNAVITQNEEKRSASVTFHVSSQRESNKASGMIPSFILCIGLMLAAVQWT